MKVLIIGGNRYTGMMLASRLYNSGQTVHCLNRTGTAPLGCTPIAYDRNIKFDPYQLIEYDVIIDMCCYNKDQVNAIRTSIAKHTQYILISSAAVYETNCTDSIYKTTSSILKSSGGDVFREYGLNKVNAECALTSNSNTNYIIIRPPYIFGENDPKRRIHRMVDDFKKYNLTSLVGGGSPISVIWDTVYIDRLLYILSIRNLLNNQIINISSEYVTSISHIINTMQQIIPTSMHGKLDIPNDYNVNDNPFDILSTPLLIHNDIPIGIGGDTTKLINQFISTYGSN